MASMFWGASSFDQDLSQWITSNVIAMSDMFLSASAFTSDLSNWDVSNVTSLKDAFWEASAFNADLSKWNTAAVTNMESTFNSASAFNADLSKWNTVAVTNMQFIFYKSGFKRTLCGGAWLSLTGSSNAFNNLGSSTARYGCCDAGTYMANPELNPFVKTNACQNCPTGWYGAIVETMPTCLKCSLGKFNANAGVTACTKVTKPCQPGYSSSAVGSAIDDPQCQSCPNGQYSDETAAEECIECSACQKGMYRPSVADRASCPKCTECHRGQFMDETSSSASQCKMCPVGQASVEGQSCTYWNYVCDDLGPGCLQVHSSSDAAFCGRKLCQHINQIVPSEEVVAMQAYNLSSDLCAKKEIDFVKSAAASLDNSNETTRIECQECSIGGECRFG